jgi:3-hydroxybutyryl-CoA dehydrogenase
MQHTKYLNAPSETRAVVVGGGIMGSDVAVVLLRAKCSTTVVEPRTETHERIREQITANLQAINAGDNISLLSFAASVHDVQWDNINLMIECVPEVLEIKQALFRQLDTLAPASTVLASNSSSFPISQIAQGCSSVQRMIGLHFFMPAHIVPLAEVVHGPATDPVAADELAAFMKRCGSVPIHVRKDVPGFIGNRLQHALGREAFSLIQEGVASAEDIDAAVRFGFGFRYLAAGPVLQKEHAGFDVHAAAAATIYPSLSTVSVPPAVLADKPRQGRLGMKSGQGFYTWTPQSMAAEKQRYSKALRAALEILADDLPAIEP